MRLHKVPGRLDLAAYAYAGIIGTAAVLVPLALPADGLDPSTGNYLWIALGSLVVLISLLVRTGAWSATGAYAAVFWLFHFGLVTVLATGLVAPGELSLWDQLWVLGTFGADAAVVTLVGFSAFAAGAGLVHGRCTPVPAVQSEASNESEASQPYGTAGAVLVLVAIVSWCGLVLTATGVAGFFGAYGDYLAATADFGSVMSFVWLALGCGLVMAVTGRRGALRTGAIAAFGGLTLVALPLGLRGEIMFPSVAAIVAAARCGWRISPARGFALVAALLLIIPAVRQVRTEGVRALPEMVLELRLFDAFVEMGGSLHPVEKVVRWRAEGEALEMGSSYWAPIERAVSRILPGIESTAAEDDMRIMNVLVVDRVGAIGFSPIAEAYRNFGTAGVVMVLGLLGAALGGIDRIADRRLAVLAIATFYVPLLTNVRNSFVSVPLQCGLGILLIFGLGMMRHAARSVTGKVYAGSPYVRSEI